MKVRLFTWCILLILVSQGVEAQDIDGIQEQKPFTIKGGVGGGANFFTSNEAQATRDPFSWNLYGHLTPSIYGIDLPLTFVVTQFQKSYTSPFSQFGISPSYKWLRLHLGYSHIRFSPLVFDGQSFQGAGLELSPGKFYLGGFYGKINKAISEDTTFDHHIQPQYARKGYGVKLGLKDDKKEFTLMYFRAMDDIESITRFKDTLTSLLPQANSVVGSNWEFTFFKKLKFTGTAAVSLWSRDLSYDQLDSIGDYKLPAFLQKLAPIDYSSVLSWSAQTQLSLMLNHFNAMVGYKRVEPDFKSLGVPYMLNDIEMISANAGTNLAKGKLSVNASFVTQHNNLQKMLSSELVSSTGNLNINTLFGTHFNLNMNVTAVKIDQKDGLLKLTDSTRMDQLMYTAILAPSLNFNGGGKQHTIAGSFNYTGLNDNNPLTADQTSGDNINASANYALFFTQKYYGFNSGISYSVYGQNDNKYSSLGLNGGINAQVLKAHNLSLQGTAGYFLNKASNISTGNNITFSINTNYAPTTHHNFGLFASYMITPPVDLNPVDELELNKVPYGVNSKILAGGITYSYNF